MRAGSAFSKAPGLFNFQALELGWADGEGRNQEVQPSEGTMTEKSHKAIKAPAEVPFVQSDLSHQRESF